MRINPLFAVDFYKQSHYRQYPEGTSKIYSNLTPRKSRFSEITGVVFFGLQYYLLQYLIKEWNELFFNRPKAQVLKEYQRMMDCTLGKGAISTDHISQLHDLGYMPLKIKALPEGTVSPIGVPVMTITNTVDHAYWLVNFLETSLSYSIWQIITSATIAFEYRKLLTNFAMETVGEDSFVTWQGHDFALRGLSSLESGALSGAGHLLSFTGTDTIPAISFLEQYYGADVEKELVGASVPATEHSVMCMGTKDDEIGTFKRLLDLYPTGILSVVSDTWDLWKVCTEYLPQLKEQIMARDGKLVIRPDSGDPADIICGSAVDGSPAGKGVIELLWETFGGTVSKEGYMVLDPHIGAIYGDSISLSRAHEICTRLKAKGFASTNIVFGIGSYTYQMNTRDTFGFAMKATYGEVQKSVDTSMSYGPASTTVTECREIFKDPITDDGTKKSAKGLLQVVRVDGVLKLRDQVTKEEEGAGELQLVFLDGQLVVDNTLSDIRKRLTDQMPMFNLKPTT